LGINSGEPEIGPEPSWRPFVLWGAGIVAVILAAWLAAAVYMPAWQVREAVKRCVHNPLAGRGAWAKEAAVEIERLGGPETAIHHISLYLRFPRRLLGGEPWHRAAATTMLLACGEKATPELIRALGNRDADVRSAAAWALGELGDSRAAVPLEGRLKDEDWNVRVSVAHSLGKIKVLGAVESLIAVLDDQEREVRYTTVWALGEIGDPRARGPLQAMLQDKDESVRQAAGTALKRLKPSGDGKKPE